MTWREVLLPAALILISACLLASLFGPSAAPGPIAQPAAVTDQSDLHADHQQESLPT